MVESGPPQDGSLDELRARVVRLESALDAQTRELARLTSDLAAFRLRYAQQVGSLHDELDELERAIAEAELGEIVRRLEEAGRGPADASASPRAETQPRYTSDAVRKLFRDVAKIIHPDLARDEEARNRRHALMIEANRAYALGDEQRLRWILEAWERSPEAVVGDDDEAARLRLERRLHEIEDRLHACTSELAELRESPLGRLKGIVDEASARGKDLVREMVGRLKRDIMAARNRLDAMRSRP
jgi:tetrahydromethanopterin S-methyltransferase subunit G